MEKSIRILCIGDVVGRPGRDVCSAVLKKLRDSLRAEVVIVNGENSSGGLGIDPESAQEIRDAGADVITLGDHTYQRKEAKDFLDRNQEWCIRPANYAAGAPGRGWTIIKKCGEDIAVFNLMGRVFINIPLDCPFLKADELLEKHLSSSKIRVCDMHAEATSEKIGMGRFLDGRVSLQVGTHTHVQTADEQILPQGSGYITDLGMTGSPEGVIGMDADVALKRFRTGMPHAYKIAAGKGVICGVCCEVDAVTGKAVAIQRVRVTEYSQF